MEYNLLLHRVSILLYTIDFISFGLNIRMMSQNISPILIKILQRKACYMQINLYLCKVIYSLYVRVKNFY